MLSISLPRAKSFMKITGLCISSVVVSFSVSAASAASAASAEDTKGQTSVKKQALTNSQFHQELPPSSLVNVERYPEANVTHPVPQFNVDASWPTMPKTMIIGQVPGLSVDKNDNVWLLHRPNSLSKLDVGLTNNMGLCCEAAPHVLQFSPQGDLLNAWGGPETSPSINGENQWPATVHGLYVDDENTVWLGGNGDGDHVVLNFTEKGEFIRQFGTRGKTDGNLSKSTLGNPADIFHNTQTNKVFIADGYINKRVTAFNTDANEFDQLWGHTALHLAAAREKAHSMFLKPQRMPELLVHKRKILVILCIVLPKQLTAEYMCATDGIIEFKYSKLMRAVRLISCKT